MWSDVLHVQTTVAGASMLVVPRTADFLICIRFFDDAVRLSFKKMLVVVIYMYACI